MATKKKLKFKKKYKISIFIVFVLIIITIIGSKQYKQYQYEKTNEFKLLDYGYSEIEVNKFISSLTSDEITFILQNEKSEYFYNLVTQKYYINDHFEEYYNYKKNHTDTSYADTIIIINTSIPDKWYEDTVATDTSKGDLILVNKKYYLEENYSRDDIVDIALTYAYEGNKCAEVAYNAFKDMYYAAKEDNLSIIVNSSYRTYDEQVETYKYYKDNFGTSYADNIAARPGSSEHQTGLALDILNPGGTLKDFENTDEYKWLVNNSYKYGFILRYPKDKEYITGFEYESWHYRYVGIEVATQIHNEGITFDEYYAYYLNK